jgi:ribosomal protein L12E/L44/L45/RPP1/RPP2
MGQISDHFTPYASDLLSVLKRIGLDRHTILIEAGCSMLNEVSVDESLRDDFSRHSVSEGDVSAHVKAKPDVRPLRGARPAWVDHVAARSVTQRL